MRQRICAGNWKMYKTASEAVEYAGRFLDLVPSIPASVEVVLCAPFTALDALSPILRSQSRVKLGAQTMHWQCEGPYTGEISAPMLAEFGVQYVILGHSERRQYCGETDEDVRRKTATALRAGLRPIVAVGEPSAIRELGNQREHVEFQIRAALEGLNEQELRLVTIAYEPIWAIGTGQNCDAADANETMRAIRSCLPGLQDVPILYGGSVKAENVAQYTAQPDIDGALVGGASLDPRTFAALARAAA
ncbi:MAG: triose-phosphate isomerase [Candidatus Baltobacteraceae bacterium]